MLACWVKVIVYTRAALDSRVSSAERRTRSVSRTHACPTWEDALSATNSVLREGRQGETLAGLNVGCGGVIVHSFGLHALHVCTDITIAYYCMYPLLTELRTSARRPKRRHETPIVPPGLALPVLVDN